MKTVKQTEEYTIYQRRDGRHAVTDANGKQVNGEDKVKILLAEELIKQSVAAAPAEEPAEEAAEAAEESKEAEAADEE